jgi:hypothetical protein
VSEFASECISQMRAQLVSKEAFQGLLWGSERRLLLTIGGNGGDLPLKRQPVPQ